MLTISLNYGRVTLSNCLNCIHDNDITPLHYDVTYTNDIVVTVDEIELVIGHLDKNKSCGVDGVYAEHLMYCSRRELPLLAMCMSTFFVHGFLPDSMLSVVLVPVIKDKCGKINDIDNYRLTALLYSQRDVKNSGKSHTGPCNHLF